MSGVQNFSLSGEEFNKKLFLNAAYFTVSYFKGRKTGGAPQWEVVKFKPEAFPEAVALSQKPAPNGRPRLIYAVYIEGADDQGRPIYRQIELSDVRDPLKLEAWMALRRCEVAVTLEENGAVQIINRFPTIKEAEKFLATSKEINQDKLVKGLYGIEAPEHMQ